MKKIISYLIVLNYVFFIPCFAQLKSGFDKEEARDMIALCNSFTFIELYNSDSEIIPKGYTKRYSSGMFGMDNKYQIYERGDVAIINIRGSTAKKVSWLENIYGAMIPATGVIKANGETFRYKFAKDTSAAVHSGYALGVAFLANDLIYQIKILNKEGIYNIILTGHSQGGALANMLRSFFENLPESELSKKNQFKTYAFAAPMAGNKYFVNEYNTRYCQNKTSFNIVIASDPIPTFPLSYSDAKSFSEYMKNSLLGNDAPGMKKLLSDGFFVLFQDNISRSVQKFAASTSKQIAKEVGPVEMPPYVNDINYFKFANRIELSPVEYPKILKDSTILKNDSLMTVYQRGEDGHFLNKELYQKESWTYQHKPYNYYVAFLEKYFPVEYRQLKKKYLTENL